MSFIESKNNTDDNWVNDAVYYGHDGGYLVAHLSCRYCGIYLAKCDFPTTSANPKLMAKAEVLSDMRFHLLECRHNPYREYSEMDKLMRRIGILK